VTVNKNVIALRAALKWGVENGYFQVNPLQNMKLLKETDAGSKVRYLTDDERSRLFAVLNEREARMRDARNNHNEWLDERERPTRPELDSVFVDHLKPMVLVSLYCGIRRGTLFGLLWGDMDFDAGVLTMRGEIIKGGKILRVPVNSIVVNTLAAWRDQSKNTSQDDLIFPSQATGAMLRDVKKSWGSVLKAANINNFRWHDMRHDFASQLVMKGVDLNTVRELMGHKDITTTQIYAHLAPEHKLKAVEVLASGRNDIILGGMLPSAIDSRM
jgi:site-specific recombinase XerD